MADSIRLWLRLFLLLLEPPTLPRVRQARIGFTAPAHDECQQCVQKPRVLAVRVSTIGRD